MTSTSQAGQDEFVMRLLVDTGIAKSGYFLDVGASGPEISNTLSLEKIGWGGVAIDNSPEAASASVGRKCTFLCADATTLDYSFLPPIVDYGSFDIDQWTVDAMRNIPWDHTKFRVITAEHDAWRFGDKLRAPLLLLLQWHGYDILCADVCHDGQPFETWAVHPSLVDMSVADKFRRDKPAEWKEILG